MNQNILNAIFRLDFPAFVERSFREIEPHNKLMLENYILFLAARLVNVAAGETRRLIINMPPRHLKSLLTSVFFAAWRLGTDPSLRIIIVSHQTDLAEKFSRYIRQIMSTEWFQHAFPGCRLSNDHNTASDFQTTASGGVRATSVNAGVTGHGADLIIVDDPLDAHDASSETARVAVNTFFTHALSSRLDDPKTGTIIIVAQRLHEDDLPGNLLRTGDWAHACLPFLAPEDADYMIGTQTWSRKQGEPLSPSRFGTEEITSIRNSHPPHVFETQWQQNPTSATAGWVKDDDFPRSPKCPENFSRCILSWDLAMKSSSTSDFSACVVAKEVDEKLYILDIWRAREEFSDLLAVSDRLIKTWKPSDILVEDSALGPALFSDLKKKGHRVHSISTKGRSKEDRFQSCLNRFKAHDIVLSEATPWIFPFLDEIVRFPYGRFDDQVDALIQILIWLNENPAAPPRVIAPAIARHRTPHPMRDPRNVFAQRTRFRGF